MNCAISFTPYYRLVGCIRLSENLIRFIQIQMVLNPQRVLSDLRMISRILWDVIVIELTTNESFNKVWLHSISFLFSCIFRQYSFSSNIKCKIIYMLFYVQYIVLVVYIHTHVIFVCTCKYITSHNICVCMRYIRIYLNYRKCN